MIEWAEPALQDVAELVACVAQDDPSTAESLAQRIFKAAEQISVFPGSGRPGRVAGTRELLVPRLPYILVYQDMGERTLIVRVLHTKREW